MNVSSFHVPLIIMLPFLLYNVPKKNVKQYESNLNYQNDF